jgi:hypothetical protein
MRVRVFTQSEGGRIDADAIARHGARWFQSAVEVVERAPRRAVLRVAHDGGEPLVATLASREVDTADVRDARAAERHARGAGLADLAERCAHVWDVEVAASGAAGEGAAYRLCAAAASVALGPVLVDGGDAIFGVRGALERAAKAEGGA